MKIFDTTFNAAEKAMDLYYRRHAILAGNVANSETPGYRARELDFGGEIEKVLKQNAPQGSEDLKKTNPLHMDVDGERGAKVVYDNSMTVGADGNNVDIDTQMNELSQNGINYNQAARVLTMKLRLIRNIAMGGRGM